MTLWWKFAVAVVLLGAAAVAVPVGGYLLKAWWDEYSTPPSKITLRRVSFFWVQVDQNIYQIGAVLRLYNLGDKPYLVKGVALEASEPNFYGRGRFYLQKLFVTSAHAEFIDDNMIRPASDATLKMLLPIKIEGSLEHPPPPGVVFVGQWSLLLGKDSPAVDAEWFGTFDRAVTQQEWASVLRPGSAIDIEGISYQRMPPPAAADAPMTDTLLFNPDRSATFSVFSFTPTPQARADSGTIVFVRGRGDPPLSGGWSILGHSYEDAWHDPAKLVLYNSIFPPAADGKPRMIGVFH
jgi:hypothetical protein